MFILSLFYNVLDPILSVNAYFSDKIFACDDDFTCELGSNIYGTPIRARRRLRHFFREAHVSTTEARFRYTCSIFPVLAKYFIAISTQNES